MNKIWLCTDVLMNIFPFFDHTQLGLKLALISPRFDVLVDTHFDGKSELTIWRPITIRKDIVAKVPKLGVLIGANSVEFPLPDHSLPNKIRFKSIQIKYIDHSVIAFLRSNQQIWDKRGINLRLPNLSCFRDDQPIWDVFAYEIWPIFAPNIRRLGFTNDDHLDNLLRRTSPKMLTDLYQLNSISFNYLLLGVIVNFDWPNGTAGQALSKWLNTPRKDGRPKQFCFNYYLPTAIEWINIFKEQFLRATTSASYEISFFVSVSMPIVPFELMNGRTNEKLTLFKASGNEWVSRWVIKRCLIGETATAVHWQDENLNHLNTVCFELDDVKRCFGPLSPPAAERKGRVNSAEVN